MSRPAIIIDDVGKAYRLGQQGQSFPSFREALVGTIKAPFERLRRLGAEARVGDAATFWALRHVDMQIEQGEVIGLIGRNGSGKSTLLKILSRITEPTEGQAELRGRVASLLEVGTGFHPELTGRENIFLNGSILGMRRAEIKRRFDEIVEFSEIAKFLDTPVKHYSSGMYVRLAFSVAAHLDPNILIVDEVLAVGDAAFQKRCLGKMQEVTRGGRTVLYVSHNLASVRSLCNRCCHLANGEIVYFGPSEEAVASYLRQAVPSETRMDVRFEPPGEGAPWMRSASLQTSGGAGHLGLVEVGESMLLSVDFASPHPVRYPKLRYFIHDSEGARLLFADNHFLPSTELEDKCTEGTFTCDLGVVPLTPGRYSITLWFGDNAWDTHFEEHALSFEVVDRDMYGLGPIPPRLNTALWWPTRFDIETRALA